MARFPSVSTAVLCAVALLPACSEESARDGGEEDEAASTDVSVEGDAPRADAREGGREDARSADAETVGGLDGAGPLTFVSSTGEVLLDRLCDIDGDGVDDNVVADLGLPSSQILAATLNANLGSGIGGTRRVLVHFPWIDDRRTPTDSDAVMVFSMGADLDNPDDPSDDLSGEEPFYADGRSLDACGEPLFAFAHTTLDDGELTGEGGTLPVPLSATPPVGRLARIRGTVGRGGTSFEGTTCFAGTIRDLGASDSFRHSEGLSMLEIFVSGGAAIGLATIPGLDPDLDLDGDGLERLVADTETYELTSCIDGDSAVIRGRDCYLDPRMADAFSMNLSLELLPALFVGREPGWEGDAEGTCDSPPEESLFDAR